MANFDNFSLASQIHQKAPAPAPVVPAPVPAPAPTGKPTPFFGFPFGLTPGATPAQNGQQLFGNLGDVFASHPLGGLFTGLASLFGGSKKNETAPTKAVIDKRPEDVQRLVSMFSNGGLK